MIMGLRYPYTEDRIFDRVISDICVILREATITISDSTETESQVETDKVRVVSLTKTEITEIRRLKKTSSGSGYLSQTL